MSRSYKNVRPCIHMVYSVEEVQSLYDVCRNTVSNWVGAGLTTSDGELPYLFRGAELKRFHDERRQRKRRNLRLGEFKCTGCGQAVFPETKTVSFRELKGNKWFAVATCCDCGRMITKLLGATEHDKIKACITSNTGLARIDEDKGELSGCIGKDSPSQGVAFVTINDRIIHDWQAYAGRYNPKTKQAHLVSIREFEVFLGGISFAKVTPKHAGSYRDHLVRFAKLPREEGGLSNSTVCHRAAQLSLFFKWLRGQSGCRRLSVSIPDYFTLPRGATAKKSREEIKPYLSIEEAWRMVETMPTTTILQRRDRAMVAFTYVCGLRAQALIAVRFKHLDLQRRTVMQDARDMEAKNSKSYRARWFPRTESFQEIFLEWIEELRVLGFCGRDGIFPASSHLGKRSVDLAPVEPIQTARPLQTAFACASSAIEQPCSPHSARHTLKALGSRICRTQDERKAWSMHLGHDDDQITERHYGKMSQEQSDALMEAMCSDEVFTEDEKDMIIDYHENRFRRGTSEYRAARRLAEKREKVRGDYEVIE
ncbi:tyrosine-type recombinase/integrase [Shimia sp. R9_3]|uniref:tyrosine-type recombinase/integrase n=1 Tax=Shimia sp. R9_3 TaxID=2821113 RepID=UPI001ADC15B0|nr:tyrosine-type recombinase/integrase [Shimia sp. R9_3]MBO9401823.1 tyrosine-type recombinase/integrase [Shimia sp. R9_3]